MYLVITVNTPYPSFLSELRVSPCCRTQLILDAVTALSLCSARRLLAQQRSSDLEVQVSVSKVTAVFIYLFLMAGIPVAVSSCFNLHILL